MLFRCILAFLYQLNLKKSRHQLRHRDIFRVSVNFQVVALTQTLKNIAAAINYNSSPSFASAPMIVATAVRTAIVSFINKHHLSCDFYRLFSKHQSESANNLLEDLSDIRKHFKHNFTSIKFICTEHCYSPSWSVVLCSCQRCFPVNLCLKVK